MRHWPGVLPVSAPPPRPVSPEAPFQLPWGNPVYTTPRLRVPDNKHGQQTIIIPEEKIPEPIKAPIKEKKQENNGLEIVTASFEVKGTLGQLKALGQYMKDNKIIYKNI